LANWLLDLTYQKQLVVNLFNKKFNLKRK